MHTTENRTDERRAGAPLHAEDFQRVATLIGLAMILVGWGIAWATARAQVAQKVDRLEFTQHAASVEGRFQVDSFARSNQASALTRIEAKVDSTNKRLSRLICKNGPTYCQ